jgi:hypothetical protein
MFANSFDVIRFVMRNDKERINYNNLKFINKIRRR